MAICEKTRIYHICHITLQKKSKVIKMSQSITNTTVWIFFSIFSFTFYVYIHSSNCEKHSINSYFYKNVLDQIWKFFNTNFWPQWIDWKKYLPSKKNVSTFLQLSCSLPKLSNKSDLKVSVRVKCKEIFPETILNKLIYEKSNLHLK